MCTTLVAITGGAGVSWPSSPLSTRSEDCSQRAPLLRPLAAQDVHPVLRLPHFDDVHAVPRVPVGVLPTLDEVVLLAPSLLGGQVSDLDPVAADGILLGGAQERRPLRF